MGVILPQAGRLLLTAGVLLFEQFENVSVLTLTRLPVGVDQWRRQGGAWGAHAPPQKKFAVLPHVPPQMRSVLCIKIYQKIFLKYNAADKPNGMKDDCIRIHALHGCVIITNVVIQSASLPATSFPGSYLRSSGEMTRC